MNRPPYHREVDLCLCPNHHAWCDLGAIRLDLAKLRRVDEHDIGREFIDYHNTKLYPGYAHA